jgi:hypothetical protein
VQVFVEAGSMSQYGLQEDIEAQDAKLITEVKELFTH